MATLALTGAAQARTVRIVSAQTLELRNVSEQELVIITSEADGGVELQVDDDQVRAQRIEFNRTRRTLTLIGGASYRTAKDGQTLRGDNLVVDLGSESLTGQDVLISDRELEIRGEQVERVPGQLRANQGYFTPCAKCGRTTNDYAFRAERLIVYPGDRLVAYRAQLLIAEHPVLYLPVVVLPLNDEARQPKIQIGQDAVDGYTVQADLPFAVRSNMLGTAMLRYYQNRSPSYGGGVDLQVYSPFSVVDRADLYALALPKPVAFDGTPQPGYDIDLNFNVQGRIDLPEAVRDLDYSLKVGRKDIGRAATDPDYGVTRSEFTAQVEYPRFSAAVNLLGRAGPEPKGAVSLPYRKTEVVVDPKPFQVGDLSADVKLTAGRYAAASNAFSPSAVRQGPNIDTTRLEEAHELRYSRTLWQGADLQFSNSFVGRYYGTGARTVQLNAAGQVTQRWGSRATLTARQEYLRYEGTSPFAFDAVAGRRLSAPLSLNLSTVPTPDTSFTVSYSRDGFLSPENQPPLRFGVGVNRRPVNLSASLDYHLPTQELRALNYSLTLADPDSGTAKLVPAVPARPATPTTPAQPAVPAHYERTSNWPAPRLSLGIGGGYAKVQTYPGQVWNGPVPSGLQPVRVRATVAGDDRSSNFSVSAEFNPDLPEPLTSVGTDYTLVRGFDTVLNPVTVSGRETLGVQYPRLTGNLNVIWRDYSFSTSHDLQLDQPDTAKESGSVNFSVGNRSGNATNWQLSYGGAYDLRRMGFTRPTLTGALTTSRPGQRLSTSLTYNLRGLDQQRAEVSRASLDGEWQGGRFSVSGNASYSRTRTGIYPNDKPVDTYAFEPLRVGVALGKMEKPDVYLTAALRQRLTFIDGVRQEKEPLSPVLGFTLDRCCWAMQGEWDVTGRRYRLTVGLPGQFYPLLEGGPDGTRVPLLPF